MEALILFLVLVLFLVPLVGLVMLSTLWSRTRQLKQQMALADHGVSDLRHSNEVLRQQVVYLDEQLRRMAAEIRDSISRRAEQGERAEPVEPVEQAEQAEQAEPVDPVEPVESIEPVEPVEQPRPRMEILEELQAAQDEGPTEPPSPPQVHQPEAAMPPPAGLPAPVVDGGWERWLGVRGAAALGAGVLVLAGLYFFKYSIEHDLINETMRVVLGTLTGLGCLLSAEAWLRRRHALLASCLSGAGIAILYLTFWAAVARYGVISTAVAGGLMLLVTATCCVLSIKRRSGAIALFGLLGGFATPLLLSTGSDRPLALFSYLLLLDVALLYVAHVRRWPLLALGSLLGTACYQGMWIIGRMGPERLGWGMLLCIIFAGLFALTTKQGAESDEDETRRGMWGMSRAAAVLLPFMFALYFGLHANFGDRFYPLAAYIGVLVIGAGAIARRDNTPWLGLAASSGALGVMSAWLLAHGLGDSPVVWWEVAGFSVAVALFTQALAELEQKRGGLRTETSMAAVGFSLGSMLITALAVATAAHTMSPWPWLLAWSLLGLLVVRHACMSERPAVHLLAAMGLGVSLLVLIAGQLASAPSADAVTLIGAALGVAVLLQLVWLLPRDRHASHAAALLPLMLLFGLPPAAMLSMELYQAAALLLVLLIGFAVVRNRSAQWLVGAAPVLAMVQWWRYHDLVSPAAGELELAFVAHAVGALLLGCWPLLLDDQARNRRWTWRAAALAGPVMFLPMLALHEQLWGDDFIAALPLALGGLGLLQLLALRRRGPADAGVHSSAVAWLGATTLGFVTVAIPLQLDNEWITIGWSLLALALLLLWRQRDHAGLKYSALALFGAVTVRLVTNPYVLDYHPRGSLRVFNWISYTYLVPVACLIGGAWLLSRHADQRIRDWELNHRGRDITSAAVGMAAVVVAFVWINLTIIDWFAVGRVLELSLERLPARDLTLSLAWALYALLLLGAGMWRKHPAMRKVSLALLLVTCGKVFLYDLAHLADLYRVMSLVGLALSLIMVSYTYQRFVFAREEPAS